MLDVHDLTYGYHGQPPLFEHFHWQVARGELWAVLGPSGCGKTTLLMLLAGLYHPQSGAVLVDGERLTHPRPRTGVVLQDYGLLPWATVEQNVRLGLNIRRFYGPDGRHAPREPLDPQADARVSYWLERLGLLDVADHYPGQISGGQRQRTALARALVLDPDLLLLDEPFASLDVPTRESLHLLTLELVQEMDVTVVMVTHALEEAAFLGQKLLLLGRPPHRVAHCVDNAHPIAADYRHSPAMQARIAALREEVRQL